MALGTGRRPGTELLVTGNALGMIGIRLVEHLEPFDFGRIVTILTNFRLGGIAFWFVAIVAGPVFLVEMGRIVATIVAGCSVAGVCGMGFVIEEHVSGDTLEHDPNGSLGCLLGVSDVGENTDDEQNDGTTQSDLERFGWVHDTV